MARVTIAGFGKQGKRAAGKFEEVWDPNGEDTEGLAKTHDIETVTIVESDPGRAAAAESEFGDKGLFEVVNQRAAEHFEEQGARGLIYDATDTSERLEDVTEAVLENMRDPRNLAYWSEKPASDKIRDIRDEGAKASMDLIENFSLQKQSVIEDIEEEGYEVESISTWRTSRTGKQVHFRQEASGIVGRDPEEVDWENTGVEDLGLEDTYDTKEQLLDEIIDWELSRNLFQQNAGSTKDKGAHDWGNILLTLEAADQETEIEIKEEESEYRVVEVEKDSETTVAYTESGEEVEVPYSGKERLNDGYADITASAGEADLRVVTALADWPEEVDEEMEELYERFRDGIEEDLGEVELVYGEEEGKEEIRVEHLEAYDPETGEEAEYLVSTGADMFTLKRVKNPDGEESYELLAEGGTDFLASYLEEGIEALERNKYDQTVSVDAAVRTGNVLDRAAETGHENRGEPVRVRAPEGTPLRTVLDR